MNVPEATTTVHPEIEAEVRSTTGLECAHFRLLWDPLSQSESDRLDLSHHVMTILQKGILHAAPIGEKPQKILDIGTGTGIWAIEMADKYPSAHVIGNDLSPIQPRWVPPKLVVSFVVEDVEKEWIYGENCFDLIYSRYMLGAISDWPKLACQAYNAIKPGGYFEILEPYSHLLCDDGSLAPDATLLTWNKLFIDAGTKIGRSFVEAPRYKEYLRAAGFIEIREEIFKLPNSPWPKDKLLKEVGGYHMASFLEALEGLSLRLFQAMHGMTVEEIHILLAKVRADLKNKSIHTYFNLQVSIGIPFIDSEYKF
ncbi:hypothetical protein Dda_5056 [Drechslerella dactyloides]|uniref:S-adenosyl-L-methionine-dependent methyltransferase n=1 Tax=Drechslerella dactyloides TaxID=74499 RepID=A0AAD6IZJ6_DREDA|nr:hypothetical protein Dda_5056 [Drechslerella dactyloides]